MNDDMPYLVATELLLSGQRMTSQFKKNCKRARERDVAPVSRSTRLAISAPKTGHQKLQARLSKANAKQLHVWSKRTLRRANRLQDLLADTEDRMPLESDKGEHEIELEFLTKQIALHDSLIEAIKKELDSRRQRGVGYRKPIKRAS